MDVNAILEKLHKYKGTGADVRQIINDAHTNGFVRAGIFKKMEDRTYTSAYRENFTIKQEDFDKALKDFLENKGANRKPIGFK